jgi:hypothetical protein
MPDAAIARRSCEHVEQASDRGVDNEHFRAIGGVVREKPRQSASGSAQVDTTPYFLAMKLEAFGDRGPDARPPATEAARA